MQFDNPLIIQSDRTLLLDVHAPLANDCRNDLIPFAELEKSPEHLHTYRLTPLSLWNATSAGFTPEDAIKVLEKYARYDVPQSVVFWIQETAGRFGKLKIVPGPKMQVPLKPTEVFSEETTYTGQMIEEQFLYLVASSKPIFLEISANPNLKKYISPCEYDESVENACVELTEDEKK